MKLTPAYLKEQEDCVRRNFALLKGAPTSDVVKYLQKFCEGAETILDVGCGAFMPSLLGATHACDVVDTPKKYLAKLKWKGKFKVCSCDSLPYGCKQFDVAVLSEVIEHLPHVSIAKQAIWEINRVAKKWIITTPYSVQFGLKAKFNTEPTHRLFFDEKKLRELSEGIRAKIQTMKLTLIMEKR